MCIDRQTFLTGLIPVPPELGKTDEDFKFYFLGDIHFKETGYYLLRWITGPKIKKCFWLWSDV